MSDLSTQAKSFWARKEGTTGMIVLAAGAVGLFFALPTLLGFAAGLITLLGQTIAITALCAVLGAMLMILTNSKFQKLCEYIFKSSMRAVTGVFVEIDPIGIMRSYITDLTEKREFMHSCADRLNGQIVILQRRIKDNDSGYNDAMTKAAYAKDKGNVGLFTVQAKQAGRLETLNKERFIPLLSQMQVHSRALAKYYEVTGTVIEDLKNEVDAREIERKTMKESYGAMSAAKKILQGGTNERELFDQAMEFVVNDYDMKISEITSFIDSSKGFVDGLDMQNGVYQAEALKKLQEWESNADSILLGNSKSQLLEHNPSPGLNSPLSVPSSVTIDYNTIVSKK